MAEIAVLPTTGMHPTQVDRLTAELNTAFEGGLDLGSRGPHILANAEAIRCLADQFEEEFKQLGSLSDLDQKSRDVVEALKLVLDSFLQFADFAERIAARA